MLKNTHYKQFLSQFVTNHIIINQGTKLQQIWSSGFLSEKTIATKYSKNNPVLDYKHWTWSRFLGSQPTGVWGDTSHKPSGKLSLHSTRPPVTFPAKEITHPWPVPNYAAWWQRHTAVCKHYAVVPSQDFNTRHVNCKSDAVSIAPPCHHSTNDPRHKTMNKVHCYVASR